jgi:proteasome lid subunit RPN8/RPN11
VTKALTFKLPGASWQLELAPDVVAELRRHIQRTRFSRESVGQLFSKDLTSNCVAVELATLTKPTWSAWSRVRFDIAEAMSEREMLFTRGWHCVGLWHTHPEPLPSPSSEDRDLAREHAVAAKRYLDGLVFAIIGNGKLPDSLRVWVDDGLSLMQMRLTEEGRTSPVKAKNVNLPCAPQSGADSSA